MADDITEVADEGDDDAYDILSALDLSVPAEPVLAPGRVNVTMRLPDDTALRVATTGSEVLFTVAGPDGMATARMSERDAGLLIDMLAAGQADARRSELGR